MRVGGNPLSMMIEGEGVSVEKHELRLESLTEC